jgi:hypothetical protein
LINLIPQWDCLISALKWQSIVVPPAGKSQSTPLAWKIICRPERLIKSQATHVVVAVTYGLEAFYIFSPQLGPHPKSSRDEDDYAHYFANGLLNGRNQLELDEEDEDGRLIPLNLQCWTLKDVGEQYQACRKVMDHLASTAIPLRVWLYPLGKLM